MCRLFIFSILGQASRGLVFFFILLIWIINEILEQIQMKILLRIFFFYFIGINIYFGFGLFFKLGYMMINKFFLVSEILIGYFVKYNYKKIFEEVIKWKSQRCKEVYVVMKMFLLSFVYFLVESYFDRFLIRNLFFLQIWGFFCIDY